MGATSNTSLSLADFLEHRYWPVVSVRYCPDWFDISQRHLRLIVRTLIADDLSTLTTEQCDLWWAQLQVGNNPPTCNKVLARLKHAMKFALRWKLIVHDPTKDIRRVPEDEREYPHLSDAHRDLLIQHAGKRLRPWIKLGAYTGARRSSLGKLKKTDVDLSRNEFIFRRPKNRKDHRVTIHPDLWSTLGDLLSSPIGSFGSSESTYLLPQYVRYKTVSSEFYKLVHRLNMAPLRFHDLRHAMGSKLIPYGVPVVMRVLGHKTATMAIRYSHTTDERARQALEEAL